MDEAKLDWNDQVSVRVKLFANRNYSNWSLNRLALLDLCLESFSVSTVNHSKSNISSTNKCHFSRSSRSRRSPIAHWPKTNINREEIQWKKWKMQNTPTSLPNQRTVNCSRCRRRGKMAFRRRLLIAVWCDTVHNWWANRLMATTPIQMWFPINMVSADGDAMAARLQSILI